jgi:hypothetical protein
MADSLVFLIEPVSDRRKAILSVLHRVPCVTVTTFDNFPLLRKAMRSRVPTLIIGPWALGGETLLAARAAASGNAACTTVPPALVLTERVSPSRISLTRQAGSADLIPCDPMDEGGLFNRITLLLRGPDALYEALGHEAPVALAVALENMPALKRRLAA